MKKQTYPVMENLIHPTAESTTLAAMRDDMDLAPRLAEMLDASDYANDKHKLVFLAIKHLLNGIEAIDAQTIAAETIPLAKEYKIKDTVTPEFVSNIVGDSRRAIAYAGTVKRMAALRRAADFSHWLIDELGNNPSPEELYTEAQERLRMLIPRTERGATLYGWDTIKHSREIQIQRRQDAESGLSQRFDWPWASWNKWIRPLRAGLVGVLAAPDGVGKSTYLEWIAEHWAKRGNKVVFIHLEDDHGYKLDRRLSRYSALPLEVVETGVYTPEQQRIVDETEERMSEWVDFLHYTHAPGWSMAEITKELQKLVDEGECDAVVLDYIDKCESDRRQLKLYGDDPYLREGDNMNMLKNFAEKAGIPIFTATQGNKSMQEEGKVQTRKAIQGSGQKSQRAQLVMILTRDIVKAGGLWDGTNKLADEGDYSPIATIRIDKQNRGATKTFYQVFRGECYRIGDLPEGFDINKLQGM